MTSNAFAEQSNPEQPNPTGSTAPDTVAGTISFTDVDLTDRPVASASFTSYTYTDASNHALTLTRAATLRQCVRAADGGADAGQYQ